MERDFAELFKYIILEQIRGIYFVDILFVMVLAALIIIVPGYVIHVKKGTSVNKLLLVYLTVVYFCVMLMITIARREAGSKAGTIYTQLNLGINLQGIYSRRQIMYSLLNFALFVPWGILLGLYRVRQNMVRMILMTTITGFVTSFIIEIIQNITRTGSFEVTDIFTNVTGTFFGALCVGIAMLITRRMTKDEIDKQRKQ